MQIGMVTACYEPVTNGVTRMVSLYKQELERLGHAVTVFTLGPVALTADDPTVVRSPGVPLGRTGYFVAPRYTVAAQLRLRQMDVLHCHHLVMSLELAHRYGTAPIVYTNHTRYDLYAAVYSRLPQSVADWAMRRLWPRLTALADGVIAPSPGVATVMRAFGVRQPVRCIPNGIDLSAFDSVWPIDLGIDGPVALYVGRISAEKNLGVLLDQFSQACNAAPDLHLVLVGDGPLLGSLRARALASPVSDRVHFVGSVPFADVPRYLAAADLFVTASTSEVHPLTVIEALAAGLPVVGVHSPGLSDMVQPGENGVLVDSAENELADAIAALANDEPRRRALGTAASAASRQYDIRVTVQRTLQLYGELLAERTMLVAQR